MALLRILSAKKILTIRKNFLLLLSEMHGLAAHTIRHSVDQFLCV